MLQILTINNKVEEKFLRKKTANFDFKNFTKKDLREIIKAMRRMMKLVGGVGLSANQVGINSNFFVAELKNKFYAIFNPKIVKFSDEKELQEEGCLSVPEHFGLVERAQKVWLEGFDIDGKKIKIKAWGFLAKIFQHEVDHLSGVLFVDKCKELHKIEKKTDDQISNPKFGL